MGRFVVLIIFFLSSCYYNDDYIKKGESPLIIDLSLESSTYSLVDSVVVLRVLPLKTGEVDPLSEAWGIQRVLSYEDRLIILDNRYMSIKVFDLMTGSQLYNIGKLGNERGEYIKIEDIFLDGYKNSLFVLCNTPNKVIEYNLNGEVVNETPLNFYASSFAYLNSGLWFFYVNQNKSPVSGNYNILVTDSLFNVNRKALKIPSNLRSTIKFSGGTFVTKSHEIYFNPAFEDTYYLVNSNGLVPKLRIDYHSHNLPKNMDEDTLLNNLGKYGFQYNTFIKTSNHVGLNFHLDGVKFSLLNVNTGNILTSDLRKDSLNILFSNLTFQIGDTIISVLDLNRLERYFKVNKKEIISRFPNFFDSIKLTDTNQNPVLLLYQINSKY